MPIQVEVFSGGDRNDIKLPAAQQQMLEALAATGKPIVVILMNGSALAVNWAQQHAQAILEAWYPGEAGGQAIAETLSGKNNPGGRLPITFYQSLDQLPPFSDYSMANRTYRYFKGKPLYGFGFGLSYSSFRYSGLKLSTNHLQAGDTLTVDADVKNSGARAGDEVAEVYLTPPQNRRLTQTSIGRLHPSSPCAWANATHPLHSRSADSLAGRCKGYPRGGSRRIQTCSGRWPADGSYRPQCRVHHRRLSGAAALVRSRQLLPCAPPIPERIERLEPVRGAHLWSRPIRCSHR